MHKIYFSYFWQTAPKHKLLVLICSVKMSANNLFRAEIRENITIFNLKIVIFTAMKIRVHVHYISVLAY